MSDQQEPPDRYSPDHVLPLLGCPSCGERRADELVWLDDERVRCQTCGSVFRPGTSMD